MKIKVKNLKHSHVLVLQNELLSYSKFIADKLLNKQFLTAITILDIANTLNFLLRNKIESDKQKFSISFSISQAAIIRQCINYENDKNRDNFTIAVLELLKNQIDPQLLNL
jgi:hypothetical protein